MGSNRSALPLICGGPRPAVLKMLLKVKPGMGPDYDWSSATRAMPAGRSRVTPRVSDDAEVRELRAWGNLLHQLRAFPGPSFISAPEQIGGTTIIDVGRAAGSRKGSPDRLGSFRSGEGRPLKDSSGRKGRVDVTRPLPLRFRCQSRRTARSAARAPAGGGMDCSGSR